MGTCSFWHKWILVVWLIIGNGRSGDVKVAARRKRPGCHLCRLRVKKAGPVETATYSRVFHFSWKDPLAAKVLISDHFWIIISWRHYHSLVGVNLCVGNFNFLRFVAYVGKYKWDFYPNGKDYFALWHFKSCLHQKYEITPFKRMENAQELDKLALATSWLEKSLTLLFPIQLNWLENIKDLTDKYLIFQLIWSLKARDLHRLPPSLFKHSQPICLPSVLANRKERTHS